MKPQKFNIGDTVRVKTLTEINSGKYKIGDTYIIAMCELRGDEWCYWAAGRDYGNFEQYLEAALDNTIYIENL